MASRNVLSARGWPRCFGVLTIELNYSWPLASIFPDIFAAKAHVHSHGCDRPPYDFVA